MKPLYTLKTVRLFRVIGVVFAGSLFISCLTASEKRETGISSERLELELRRVHKLRSDFQKFIRKNQPDSLTMLISKEAKIVPPGGDAWKILIQRVGPNNPMPYDSIHMMPEETAILNDSMAYDWGKSKVYYTDSTGTVQYLEDSYLVLLKKENDQWRLFREVASSTVNHP